MNPIDYLNFNKEDILYNLIFQNRFIENEAVKLFEQVKSIIGELSTVRHSESLTESKLEALNNYPDKDSRLIKHWLLKAIQFDNSFIYSFNSMAIECNRDLRMIAYSFKEVDIEKLSQLIRNETNNDVINNPFVYKEEILDSFHGIFNGYLWDTTDIYTFKNWFKVTPIGKPNFKEDMTSYFCYAVSKIEPHINIEFKPKNFGEWIRPTINGNSYSKLKSQIIPAKRTIIDERLNRII